MKKKYTENSGKVKNITKILRKNSKTTKKCKNSKKLRKN